MTNLNFVCKFSKACFLFFDKRKNLAIPTTINLSRVANLQNSDFLTAHKYQIALM